MNKLLLLLFLLCFEISKQKKPKCIELAINCLEQNGYCVIPVYFGSNNETFQLQLDTTTSFTWIPSNIFDMDVPKYNISESKFGKSTNRIIKIEDEEGTIYGKLNYDYVRFENIGINNYGFVLADYHEKYFVDYPKGKLGLGYYHEKGDFNFIQKLKEMELIDEKIFIIDKFSKKLVIGKIPTYLLELPSESCSLYDVSYLGNEYRQSWACEMYKIFCGVNIIKNTGFYFDKDGNPIPYEYEEIDFRTSKDAYIPAIFDRAYPYIRLPIGYSDYIKGNLIMKYLKGTCSENIDENYLIYFICKKEYINLSLTYLQFFINRKMFFLLGSDLFKTINYAQSELLIRFSQKEDNVAVLGFPFLNNLATVYDFDDGKIIFYGQNIVNLTSAWIWYNIPYYIGIGLLIIIPIVIILVYINTNCCEEKKLNGNIN